MIDIKQTKYVASHIAIFSNLLVTTILSTDILVPKIIQSCTSWIGKMFSTCRCKLVPNLTRKDVLKNHMAWLHFVWMRSSQTCLRKTWPLFFLHFSLLVKFHHFIFPGFSIIFTFWHTGALDNQTGVKVAIKFSNNFQKMKPPWFTVLQNERWKIVDE